VAPRIFEDLCTPASTIIYEYFTSEKLQVQKCEAAKENR
jgi:hypothetical protein